MNKQDKEFTNNQVGSINRLLELADKETTPSWLKKHLPKIATKTKAGDLNVELVQELARHADEDKYQKSEDFQQFVKILAQKNLTKLPLNGEGLFFLMNVILGKHPGNDRQQALVRQFLKETSLKRVGFPLSAKQLEKLFDDIRQAEFEIETPEQVKARIQSEFETSQQAADISKQTESVVPKESSKIEHESFNPQQTEALREFYKKEQALMAKFTDAPEEELQEIDQELTQLRASNRELKEAYVDFEKRQITRKRILRKYSNDLGFNLDSDAVIATSVGEVKVKSIYFDMDRDGTLPEDLAGTPMISYTINGVEMIRPVSLLNFIRDVQMLQAQFIGSLEDLNKNLSEHTHNTPLEVGQSYESLSEMKNFAIKNVDNKQVTITKKIVLPHLGIQNEKPRDTFNLSEFARLIRAGHFYRHAHTPELPEIFQQNIAQAKKQEYQLPEVVLPTAKDPLPQRVYILDGNTLEEGDLTIDPQGTYYFKPDRFTLRTIDQMRAAGLPERLLTRKQKDFPNHQGQKRPLTNNQLIQLHQDGDLYPVPQFAANDDQEIAPEITLNQAGPAYYQADEDEKNNIELPEDDEPGATEEELEALPEKPKYNVEALPYEQARRVGKTSIKEDGYLKSLWDDTRFMTIDDLFQMGKTMWEYYDRRFQTKQKQKYSQIGQDLPYFSPEFQRINQSAENEEVNQFQETLDQFGVLQIMDRLHSTSNIFEMKAAFIVLVGKGQLRFDDVKMWENFNQFLPSELKIPIPHDRNPYTIVDDSGGMEKRGMDYLKPALDDLWGEGTYDDWMSSNKGAYASNAGKYAEEGKALESLEGGYGVRLAQLLSHHKAGGFVDPQRYEGLILAAIDNGKASIQDKIYYMIEGVAAVNPEGRTIMDFDRIAHINSTYLPRFPILEYLCSGIPRQSASGEIKSYRFTLEDYKRWSKWFNMGNPDNVKPNKAVDDFMWRYAISSDQNQTRVNKVRSFEGIDHDDMFAYITPMGVQTITDITNVSALGGGTKPLTVEGYKNVYPGFSEYFRVLSDKGEINKLQEALAAYTRFDSIIQNRYEKNNTAYQRINGRNWDDRPCVVDPHNPPAFHAQQMHNFVQKVIDAYVAKGAPKADKLAQTYSTTLRVIDDEHLATAEGKEEQENVNAAIRTLPNLIKEVTNSDGGRLMLAITRQVAEARQLYGMPYTSTEAKLAAKAAAEINNPAAAA